MRRISSWRAIGVVIMAGLVFVVLAVVLFWLAVVVCALGLALWLHLVGLPRLAERMHLPLAALEVLLLLALFGAGLFVGGWAGAATGVGVWLLSVGLPGLLGKRLRPHVRALRWTTTLETDNGELRRRLR